MFVQKADKLKGHQFIKNKCSPTHFFSLAVDNKLFDLSDNHRCVAYPQSGWQSCLNRQQKIMRSFLFIFLNTSLLTRRHFPSQEFWRANPFFHFFRRISHLVFELIASSFATNIILDSFGSQETKFASRSKTYLDFITTNTFWYFCQMTSCRMENMEFFRHILFYFIIYWCFSFARRSRSQIHQLLGFFYIQPLLKKKQKKLCFHF